MSDIQPVVYEHLGLIALMKTLVRIHATNLDVDRAGEDAFPRYRGFC